MKETVPVDHFSTLINSKAIVKRVGYVQFKIIDIGSNEGASANAGMVKKRETRMMRTSEGGEEANVYEPIHFLEIR